MIETNKKTKSVTFTSCGFAILFLFHTTVFTQNTQLNVPAFTVFGLVFNVIFCVYAVVTRVWGTKINKRDFLLSLVPIIFFIIDLLSLATNTTIFNLLPTITISLFCLSNPAIKRETFHLAKVIIVIEALFGIVSYILFVTNILPPLSAVDFYEEGSTNLYVNYYYLSVLYVTPSSLLCRLCCLFNEPGWLGTFCALFLIVDKCNLKRIGNIIIFIAGILAFSLAFWILLVLYVFIRLISERKWFYLLLFALIIFIFYYYNLGEFSTNNEAIDRLLSRFVFEDGEFAGDDRTSDDFMLIYDEVKSNLSKLLFGVGRYVGDTGSSSYIQLIVNYGIIGTLLFLFPLLVISLKYIKNNKYALCLLVCFMASIFQRPTVITLAYFIILFGGIETILYEKSIKK